jgi:hypothetical protein
MLAYRIRQLREAGMTANQISQKLGLVVSTVRKHSRGVEVKYGPMAIKPKIVARRMGYCPVSGRRLYHVTGPEWDHICCEKIVILAGWAIEGPESVEGV